MLSPLDAYFSEMIRRILREELKAVLRYERPARKEREVPAASKERPEYLKVDEAAEIAAVRPSTVRGWVDRRLLPGHHAGRLVRIRADELHAFLSRAREPRDVDVDIDERASDILVSLG